MQTECRNEKFGFQACGTRQVVAEFNGDTITSDGGALLLKEVEAKRQIIKQFAACFTDHRDPDKIEHKVEELLAQRIFGLALGYEDLNDHDLLRRNPPPAADPLHGKQEDASFTATISNAGELESRAASNRQSRAFGEGRQSAFRRH